MALTVFTACDASVGAPMGPKPSDAASAKALCDRFKKTYSVELSEKAYSIANWVAGTSVSCDTSKDKTEFYRVVKANNEARASLKEEKYATAFENLSMGAFGPDNFVPGFEIETEWSLKDDTIRFTLPKDGSVTETMTKAAEGKTKLGVAYVVKDGVSYAVVRVWVNFITTNKAAVARESAAAALFVLGYDQPSGKPAEACPP